MFKTIIGSYARWLATKPLSSRIITTGAIVGIGDLIGQAFVQKRTIIRKKLNEEQFDNSRFIRAIVVGAFGIAPNLIVWYQYLLPGILGLRPFKNLRPILKSIAGAAIDQTTFSFWVISNYMFWVSYLEFRDLQSATENVKINLWNAMLVNWMIWPGVTFVNLMFVPLIYRTLFVNFFALGWNLYLSLINEQGKKEIEERRESSL